MGPAVVEAEVLSIVLSSVVSPVGAAVDSKEIAVDRVPGVCVGGVGITEAVDVSSVVPVAVLSSVMGPAVV